MLYLCDKFRDMIIVKYKNTELESLFNRGYSTTFKAIANKKLFMQALYSFKRILSIINYVIELEYYKSLHYKHNTFFCNVTIDGAGQTGNIIFTEENQGTSITIYDLLLNKDYGKKGNI